MEHFSKYEVLVVKQMFVYYNAIGGAYETKRKTENISR